jgi:hypothetical protein
MVEGTPDRFAGLPRRSGGRGCAARSETGFNHRLRCQNAGQSDEQNAKPNVHDRDLLIEDSSPTRRPTQVTS